jgi:hypothetical protein
MRYLTGVAPKVANETITSHMLIKHMVSEPDILPGITRLWKNDITQLSAILAERKMFSKGLGGSQTDPSKYRVVSQNHVQYAIENSDNVKVRLVNNPATGKAFKCDAYPTEPGKNQSPVTIYVDENWLSPKDVFEFGDSNHTQGWIYDERLPEQTTFGAFALHVKIMDKDLGAFFDPELLDENSEIGFAMTAFEHDFSETAYEKYTFDGWGHAYMTLQRMKYSWSGTAKAMAEGRKWIQTQTKSGKTVNLFLEKAQDLMMRRWARAHEFANVFGKGNVSIDGITLSKDSRNREVMMGSGLLHQGDGAFRYPIFEWNRAVLEGILSDIRIKTGKNGKIEVVALLGQSSYNSFQRFMLKEGNNALLQSVWSESDGGVGKSDTYTFYEFGGVRIIPILYQWFASPDRPQRYLPDGSSESAWEGIIISLGNTTDGDNGIEMVTLKDRLKMGSVNGINEGGNNMANTIDGGSHHILFQSGIINRNQQGIARLYRPSLKKRA